MIIKGKTRQIAVKVYQLFSEPLINLRTGKDWHALLRENMKKRHFQSYKNEYWSILWEIDLTIEFPYTFPKKKLPPKKRI